MRSVTVTITEKINGLYHWDLLGQKQNINSKLEKEFHEEGVATSFESAMKNATSIAEKLQRISSSA